MWPGDTGDNSVFCGWFKPSERGKVKLSFINLATNNE